jgi:hypothetical protein
MVGVETVADGTLGQLTLPGDTIMDGAEIVAVGTAVAGGKIFLFLSKKKN